MKIPSLEQIWESLVRTFKRFPFAVVAALIGTGISIYSIKENINDDWMRKALMIASLSVFFFTALALGTETIKKISREFVMGAGVMLIILYYFLLPENLDFTGEMVLVRHIFLCLASFIAIIWAPFWQKKVKNETIWEWVRQIIMNLVQTVFFGIVIFAGIAAALFALKSLFGLETDGKTYFQLWVAIVGTFGPLHFLSNLDKNPRNLKTPKPIPTFMKVLTKYILTPLAIGYFLILYTYTFKVLLTWEWPKNLLSWLVIGFSVVAVLAYFLWTPFWKEKIFAKYHRLFWWGLLPQIAMLFIAIGWRIQVYSWTENRYFVVILGLWLLGISIYFLINKKATFKSIFVALTAIILISQLGPLSGYSVGERAQKGRLINLLKSAHILQNGEIIPAKIELNKQIRYDISDTIDYLVSRHGKESVRKIFPKILTKLEKKEKVYRYGLASDITKNLGFNFINDWEMHEDTPFESERKSFTARWDSPRNIAGYDWFLGDLSNSQIKKISLGERIISTKINKNKESIEIFEGESSLAKIDLTEFINNLQIENISNNNYDIDPEKMSYEYETEKVKVKLFFTNISLDKEKIDYLNAQVYMSFK